MIEQVARPRIAGAEEIGPRQHGIAQSPQQRDAAVDADKRVVGRDLEAGLSVRFDPQKLPAWARGWVTGPKTPSALWSAVPDDALFAAGGRFRASEVLDLILVLLPEDGRKTLSAVLADSLGPVVGIVSIDVDSSVSGTIDIGDIGAVDIAAQAGESLMAPKLGLSYVHAFNEHLRLTADVATFEHSIRGGDAQIWDTAIGAEWYPWKNVGFALRHARTRIDADIARADYDGSAELGFSGWQFLVRTRF